MQWHITLRYLSKLDMSTGVSCLVQTLLLCMQSTRHISHRFPVLVVRRGYQTIGKTNAVLMVAVYNRLQVQYRCVSRSSIGL